MRPSFITFRSTICKLFPCGRNLCLSQGKTTTTGEEFRFPECDKNTYFCRGFSQIHPMSFYSRRGRRRRGRQQIWNAKILLLMVIYSGVVSRPSRPSLRDGSRVDIVIVLLVGCGDIQENRLVIRSSE